ncbi:MAG: substrate-binding domain-containing protein [Prevotella sp.]|nr:substrate-binding domain-containing protein [Prevotella sp.]
MQMKLSYIFVVLFISSLFLSSCKERDRGGRTDTRTSGEITFYADESFSPIVEELREQFEFQYPQAHLKPVYTNEIEGFNQIKELKTCLFFTSRALKPSEVSYLKTKRQLPECFPIAYDGLSLIVNTSNNDTCITVKDVKRILSGEAKNWNDIVKGSNRGEIEVVFDNKNSATLHYVVDSILDGKPINSPNIVAAKTSKEVIDYVHETPNAIGVIGSNWLNDHRDSTNTTFKKNIHVMSVSMTDEAKPYNSWKPYQVYLLDGRYPFVRTIYCILVDPQRALPYSFAHYVTSPRGQLIVLKSGMLPYRGDIVIKEVKVK